MEAEELVAAVNDWLNSPHFLVMTDEQRDSAVKYGVPMMISVFVGLKMMESANDMLKLEQVKKDLEMLNLEVL